MRLGYRLGLVLIPPPERPPSILHASADDPQPKRLLGSLSVETIVGAVGVALALLGMHTDTTWRLATQDANLAAQVHRVDTLDAQVTELQKQTVSAGAYDRDTRQLDMVLRQMNDRQQAIYTALIERRAAK